MKYALLIALIAMLFSGCSIKESVYKPSQEPKEIKPQISPQDKRQDELLASIEPHIGKRDGKDCSGFVSLINAKNNHIYFDPKHINNYFDDSRKSKAIYNLYKEKGKLSMLPIATPGDLIFFSDRPINKSKKIEKITHIGIVTKVDSDGTIHFAHNTKGKNQIWQINFNHPSLVSLGDKKINSYFQSCGKKPKPECLAPAYFRGFGYVFTDEQKIASLVSKNANN